MAALQASLIRPPLLQPAISAEGSLERQRSTVLSAQRSKQARRGRSAPVLAKQKDSRKKKLIAKASKQGSTLPEVSITPDGEVVRAGEEETGEDVSMGNLRELTGQNINIAGQETVAFDYGFQATFLKTGPMVPGSVLNLALENFRREFKALRRNVRFTRLRDPAANEKKRGPLALFGAYVGRYLLAQARSADRALSRYGLYAKLTAEADQVNTEIDFLRQKLNLLTLDNDKIWARERSRPPVKAPWYILGPYYFLCWMLDVLYDERPIQRFWFLETVARMPYFSYISMLHLYETLGWWRVGAEVRKVHFAEEWNEMHHLKIMESLGGDLQWVDRFFAQHAAIAYYWVLNLLFFISPSVAYNFSELIESHAVDTYGEFVDANADLLKTLPPSPVAVAYYQGEDLYMFDEFQTSRRPASRRPPVDSLYDVFCNIRDDESEHVKTMVACQDAKQVVVSPNRAASMARGR